MILEKGDYIASMLVLNSDENPSILVITEQGFGKKTDASMYRSAGGRYVKGLRTIDNVKKTRNGLIVAGLAVTDEDDYLVLTSKGKMIRNRVADIKSKGRTTMGVPLVSLDQNDTVQSVVVVKAEVMEEIQEEVS
jgi:DNA gyrase subunit A